MHERSFDVWVFSREHMLGLLLNVNNPITCCLLHLHFWQCLFNVNNLISCCYRFFWPFIFWRKKTKVAYASKGTALFCMLNLTCPIVCVGVESHCPRGGNLPALGTHRRRGSHRMNTLHTHTPLLQCALTQSPLIRPSNWCVEIENVS
jgi:hypothetical protein